MNPPDHLIVAFAAPHAFAPALGRLPPLPHTAARLARARLVRDEGDLLSLSPPHERVLARARGWPLVDGLLPFAAEGQSAPCGWLTPVHWQAGADHVTLQPPALLALPPTDALALLAALQTLCDGDWRLTADTPTRWRLHHPSLAQLPTAALTRAAGRNVDPWLNAPPAARAVRRLQAEMQMLLHTHPVNAAREAAGLAPVNSVWLSGTGAPVPAATTPQPRLDERLTDPALANDFDAWCTAWAALDAGPIAALAPQAALTLCGERSAVSLTPAPPAPPWRRWLAALRAPRTPLTDLLAAL